MWARFFETVNVRLEGPPRPGDVANPVAFAELAGLFDDHLRSGREVSVAADVGLEHVSGDFVNANWLRYSGDFRRAPSGVARIGWLGVAHARRLVAAAVLPHRHAPRVHRKEALMRFRTAFIALAFVACVPASADQLRFEGTFDTVVRCSEARSTSLECTDAVAIAPLPFALSIDLAFRPDTPVSTSGARIHRNSRTVSDRWSAPNLVPQLLLDRLGAPPDRATFENVAPDVRRIRITAEFQQMQRLAGTPGSFIWHFSAASAWVVDVFEWSEELQLTMTSEGNFTDEQQRSPVTFDELIGFFEDYRASGRRVPLTASYHLGNIDPPALLIDRLTGDFRLTAICRAPSGVSRALAGLTSRMRGGL